MMECVNVLVKEGKGIAEQIARAFVVMLEPFAPHLAEELHAMSGGDGTGAFTFELSATDSQALTPGEWLDYSVRVTLASGAVIVPERGRFRIDAALSAD